jgi:hypothetical protein
MPVTYQSASLQNGLGTYSGVTATARYISELTTVIPVLRTSDAGYNNYENYTHTHTHTQYVFNNKLF